MITIIHKIPGTNEKIVLRIDKTSPAVAEPLFPLLFATPARTIPTIPITKATIESHPKITENETQANTKETMPKTKDAIAIQQPPFF